MTFRKTIFWAHLACGLFAGIVIFIMSFTGVVIAFEHEILDWVDRDVNTVEVPEGAEPMSMAALEAGIVKQFPDFKPAWFSIPRDDTRAYLYYTPGWARSVYVNPYTGDAAEPVSGPAHDFLHTMEMWHRFLGMDNDNWLIGRMINGIFNLAFLFLCLSGLYLWFPKRLIQRMIRPRLWFISGYKGKARDLNWHNVFGFWSLPVLVVLVATAVVISFGWAHDLVFRLAGEEPPEFRDFRMMLVPASEMAAPAPDATPLPYDAIVANLKTEHPDWQSIEITLPRPPESPDAAPVPLDVTVIEPALFSTAGRVMMHIHPFTGEKLQSTAFDDRSPGLRARVWVRFLHTGEAFGLIGKIVATIATAASLFLVYTGFALAWRRFVPRKRRA